MTTCCLGRCSTRVFSFINPREFAAQSPATGELPLEVLGEVEAGAIFPELDEQ